MKQECLQCERTSPDNNLYCQEIYCPAEGSPTILDYGDWLGNIEIVKPIIVLRSAVLYEARCQNKKVLLKVAHPGAENRDRLKREAQFLKSTQTDKTRSEYLPVWLPPYSNSHDEHTYGRVVLKSRLLYYCLFEHFDGEPLRAILAKNYQLWVYHIGGIMTRLAFAVAYLQSKGLFHFGLSPDTVLVRSGDDPAELSVLLFDLGIVSKRESLALNWYSSFVPPAYTAPELIDRQTPGPTYTTDVYGLGLILYELLVGQPAFPYELHSDDEVYEAVRHGQDRRTIMTRSEDVRAAADIATKAVDQDPSVRYRNAAEMVKDLHGAFGEVPEKKRPLRLVLTLFVVLALLAIVLLVVVFGH